jgi:hypothetical protein
VSSPVCFERSVANSEGVFQYRSVYTFCPACEQAHPFTVELAPGADLRADGSPQPVWGWDGNAEQPTFSPSMLCYGSVHLCAGEHGYIECEGGCGSPGHAILWRMPDGSLRPAMVDKQQPPTAVRVLGHPEPHTREPSFGNCHSFLKNGVWEFLGDCAHPLAGQNVPMMPLPDWLCW